MNNTQLSIMAGISACNARIAAMQALNSCRIANNMTPAYDESYFWDEVAQLEQLSVDARNA